VGIEVQKPPEHKTTQALKAVKIPGNTFDLNPKWTRLGGFLHLKPTAGCQISTDI
jgi:hypothetical protein